jgi:hypothetical protein
LPKAKALLPLFEAVMNAFQAIEEAGGKGHYIRITAERQGNLDDGRPGPIEAFTVSDSGIGTVDSPIRLRAAARVLAVFLVESLSARRSRKSFPRRCSRASMSEVFFRPK